MKFTNVLRCLATLILAFAFNGAFAQGVTTASMDGTIRDANGEALIGANIVAVHQPTGTTYGNATNLDGIFRVPYMKIGGPYTVTVSYTGYEDFVRENVYLDLGQTFKLNVKLQETALELEGVTVTASKNAIIDGERDGQSTVVDEELINTVPTLSRSIADFARFNPLASVTEDSDGFAFSIAGQNQRYNSIYFDGTVANDAFGLADSGTDGGQTGISPISLDAIETFTIAAAPFDIRQSGFAGGTVNAVTRSGTNNFEGSAYYLFRNESLAGKEIISDTEVGDELTPFTARTYGVRLGGPIVKNKLFFFVNAEIQDDETPQPFDFSTYRGDSDLDKVNEVINTFQDVYGYDVGTFDNNTAQLEGLKLLGKLDWTISDKHSLTLRHSYTEAENLEARGSDNNDLRFINGSEFFVSKTNSTVLELNSVFNNNTTNRLNIGWKTVRDDRDVFGPAFPQIDLDDLSSGADYTIGGERFSSANLLNQDVLTITNDFSIYKGRHNALIGVNFEYFNAGNLFIRENYGYYRWFNRDGVSGVDRFLAGEPANTFSRSFSQVDNVTGDDSEAIAAFEQMLLGFYLQDEYQVNDNFKLTGGLRLDLPIWPTDVPLNAPFNNETIPQLEAAGYDLKGARTGTFIGSQVLFSPRLSFNWDVTGDQETQVRGGLGIFTSRLPLVWPGGAYNNYGFNVGGVFARNVPFVADPFNQPVGFDDNGNPITQVDVNDPTPSGQIDLFAEDFKLPQVFKLNLAVDQKLPWGLIGTLEGIYTKNVNAVRYESINLVPPTRSLEGAGPDTRPIFNGDLIDPTYAFGTYLASNTDKGYAFNFAATLTKPFTNGFTASLSYSFGDSYSIYDGTSSQNSSQQRGYHAPLEIGGFNGSRNGEFINGEYVLGDPQRSTFAQGHRIFGYVSYAKEYAKYFRSSLSINFNAETRGFISYVVGADVEQLTNDRGFDFRELFYVPNALNEIPLVETEVDGQTFTPEQQWAILDAYIDESTHLSDRRGNYAQRNGEYGPFNFTMDLRFNQDFFITLPNGQRNTLTFTFDIFNFTNLINSEWGHIRLPISSNYGIVNMENTLEPEDDGSFTNVPQYTVDDALLRGEDPRDPGDAFDNSGLRSSIWQAQIGLRYTFGGRR